MKKYLFILFFLLIPNFAFSQENQTKTAPVSFELEEEKLSIEADIPSVDLILSFREMQERRNAMKESFIDEIIESAKKSPF